jgi:putative ABC transport system permease protein
MNDLRFAFRQLLKNPGFTIVAVLTLALGIGANTAMFSVLNILLFRPLPYPNAERIVRVFRTSPHSRSWPHSAANFVDYREQNKVFEHIALYQGSSYNITEADQPAERLNGMRVTADFFPALGVNAAIGRVFTAEEDQPGADQVIVLSDSFWMRQFSGDTNVIGRTVRIDGQGVEVIGVMPPRFEHPLLWGNNDLWRPMAITPEQRDLRDNNSFQIMGRLKPGISLARAESEMKALFARLAKEHPGLDPLDSVRLEPLKRSVSDEVGRSISWFAFGLAGFVLLIGCANLANLQLVRTAARTREFALRAALGAQRARLLRQSLTESLVVSLLGGALGLLFALWCNQFLGRQLFTEVPGVRLDLDLRVFGFALFCSVFTGVAFGTIPAWMASRTDVNEALKENLRGTTAGRSHHRLQHAFIVGEVGFALVLLAGATLFLGGIKRFIRLDPGWRMDNVVFAQLSLKGTNYARSFQRRPFLEQLESRLRAIPGVESVGLSESLLIWPFGSSGGLGIEGRPLSPGQPVPEVYREAVSTNFFSTMGIRLQRGRSFNSYDTTNGPTVVIINETMARHFWPGESAVGKRIGGPATTSGWNEIVGVVADVRFPASLGAPYTRFQSYRPMAQSPANRVSIALHSAVAPEVLARELRRVVAELDRDQSVHQVRTARGHVDRALGSVSLLGRLLTAFAALGLGLAALGIYGVTSYSVVQRTGEIGIRMALGAQRSDVLWLMLNNGLRLSLMGALLGLAGAYVVARILISAIPALPTRDPMTVAAATLALMSAALLASYIPARRATRVTPMEALRYE